MELMKQLISIAIVLLISFFSITPVFSADSREIIEQYFSKTQLSTGPELPDLDELKQIIKGGVNLNYEEKQGSPNVLHRLGNVAYKAWYAPREQVDKRMRDLLETFVGGGLVVKSNCSENVYIAISENMWRYLDALMECGCDISQINIGNEENSVIVNAIDLADKWGHEDLVKVFLKHGQKMQPEKVRVQLKLVGGAEKLKKSQIILAVNNGAVINMPDMHGKTALQELLESNDVVTKEGVETLRLLLNLGANPNIKYKNGDYPLHAFIEDKAFLCKMLGCEGYDIQALNMLIKSGALVSSKAGFLRRTPLHIAAEKNYYHAARVLVENGAKVMVMDKIDKTPLDLTESGEIVKLLKDNGAVERGY